MKKHEIIIPTDEQIKNILFCAKNTAFYIPIMLAAFGGMRRAEICALEMDDINGNIISVNKEIVCDSNGVWVKKPPKSFSGNRNIEMPPFVINAIKEKETIYNGTPHALTKGFDKLLKRNNLPDFRFHDLRHYYVSYLFDMNVPEKYIIAQVGHSSSSITRRVYDHLQSKKQTEYGERIANAFKNFL